MCVSYSFCLINFLVQNNKYYIKDMYFARNSNLQQKNCGVK